MKLLIIILTFILINCTSNVPKFKVGDCLQTTIRHEFFDNIYYDRILKVGQTHYLIGHNNEQDIEWTDNNSDKIDCKEMK